MNVTRLQQPPLQSSSSRSASEAEDVTPDFLSIRLVNKRARIRISQEPLDLTPIPNKGQLFVVASTLEWFVAIIRSSTGPALVSSPLADLRSHLSSLDGKSDNTFQPQRIIPISTVTPNHLIFACNDTRLVVGLTHGPVIVFEASSICSPGNNEVTPLHTFLPTTPTPTAVRQMYANPGDFPQLVAILREPDGSPDSQLVEVINVSTMQSVAGWSSGGTPETFPTSISWSPKGKQLAIALQSGDIVTFSPTETQQAKSFITRPSSMQGQGIIHTTWLSNPAFYAVFAPTGPLDPQVDQKHMVIVQDPKRPDVSADISIPINFFPSGIRPPGAFTIALKGWDPAKILLLVGDSTTADIGLAYCTADDKWQKLSFDEGAPSMPLDADQNETTMIGLELDLKNTTPYDVTTSTGETVSVPPPPVVWAYASDGTVTAWYVVNTRGTQYPSMGPASALSPVLAQAAPSVPTTGPFSPVVQPGFAQSSQSTFGQPSQPGGTFGSAGPTPPAFGQPAFSTSASTFGQSTFGNPTFSQTTTASTYGQTSPPGQAPSSGGFAAFAPTQVKWGQTNYGSTLSGFGSGTPAAPPPQIRPAESTESMSTDSSQDLSLGGMSLGGGSNAQPKGGLGMTSMFGGPTVVVQPATSQATTTFGGSSSTGSFLSPGVGAFAKFVPNQTDETSTSTPNRSSATTMVEAPKPSPAFGQTGFAAAPTFGQSGFATQPSFDHSHPSAAAGFGKTAAGLGTPMSTTPIVTPVSTTSSTFGGGSGGGFGAFASGGPATLSGAKPLETKQGAPATSGGGAFGAFASGGPSSFSQAASDKSDSSVPAWKTGGDATFASGAGSTVFGGAPGTTLMKSSPFGSAVPAASTTPSTTPLAIATSAERARASTTTPSTSPITTTPAKSQSQSPPTSTAPTSPLVPADAAKPNAPPPASTTPAVPPPVPHAFMGLKMSTGFGLSNFNAKDSPFANRKPIPEPTVSAFGGGAAAGGGGQPSMPKMPVPATPGSVFGQTSSIGTATARAVSAFGQPAFGSPSMLPSTTTPSTTPTTSSSSSQTASGYTGFSAFSGATSAFGKTGGSGLSFGDMLRNTGASPESSKLKTPETTPRSAVASTPGPVSTTPQSAFDKSPTPQPAKILAAQDSGDEEEEGEKDEDRERRVTSAASSFSNLSSSTSSFVSIPHGGEEEEEEGELAIPASDGADDGQGTQQIDEFLYSEGEVEEEEEGAETHEESEEEEEEEEEDNALAEADPTVVPLPESRSPSSTPKSEGLTINVQPPVLPYPQPKAASSSRARSTTPPGSPSKEPLSLQTPLEHPTPTLPSPSLSAPGVGSGRPGTRPLRSSPLANAPVSGGDEEEVKGEKPKPRPASPKTPFGQWDGAGKPPSPPPSESKPTTPAVKVEPLVDQINKVAPPAKERPMTPPPPVATTKGAALNNKPSTSSTIPPPIVAAPGPVLNLSGFSLGAADAKPVMDGSTNLAIPSAFAGLKPGLLSLSPKPEASNAETPPAPDTKPLPTLGTTPKMPLAPAAGLPFGGSLGPLPFAVAPATMTPPKDTAPLEPMAREFMSLYTELDLELAKLGKLSREQREQWATRPGSFVSPVDVKGLEKTIREVAPGVEQLGIARNEDRATIRELEIGLLKAKTRKEEIARFDKARSDVEFGNMLKTRMLSPEQTELQTQLRRGIQAAQDRVTKMEDHLDASKKKLNELRTGKPCIKPPSLDTVNRTSRNIDLAIRQQTTDVSTLSTRIARLNLNSSSPSSTPPRVHERELVRRPLDVTPHVASATAAALNAEQAAHRLKDALLSVRTEPLRNTQAVHAKSAPRAYDTPQKVGIGLASNGGSGGLFLTPFTLPPLGVAASASPGASSPWSLGRRATPPKHHAKSVPLKSTPTSTAGAAAFDWGPLPGIKPMTTLSSDLRSKTE